MLDRNTKSNALKVSRNLGVVARLVEVSKPGTKFFNDTIGRVSFAAYSSIVKTCSSLPAVAAWVILSSKRMKLVRRYLVK